jgi:hypothetical protein
VIKSPWSANAQRALSQFFSNLRVLGFMHRATEFTVSSHDINAQVEGILPLLCVVSPPNYYLADFYELWKPDSGGV